MACALKVDTRRKGWYEITSNLMSKIRGVRYNVDAKKGMLYISGKGDPNKILNMVSKNVKNVQLCWMRSEDQYIDANSNMDRCGTLTMPAPSAYPYHVEPPYHREYCTPPPPPLSMPYYQYHNYEPMPPPPLLYYHSQMPYNY